MNETDFISKIILGTAVQKDFESISPYLKKLILTLQSIRSYKVLSDFSIDIRRMSILSLGEDLFDVIITPSHRYDLILGKDETYRVIKRTLP